MLFNYNTAKSKSLVFDSEKVIPRTGQVHQYHIDEIGRVTSSFLL